jgi:hypothetical protein
MYETVSALLLEGGCQTGHPARVAFKGAPNDEFLSRRHFSEVLLVLVRCEVYK